MSNRFIDPLFELPASPGDFLGLTRRALNRAGGSLHAFPVSIERLALPGGEDGLEIKADLPGISREAVEVSVSDSILTIRVIRDIRNNNPDRVILLDERTLGREEASRRFFLNEGLDATTLRARLKDGVLTLTIMTRRADPARQVDIEIETAMGTGEGKDFFASPPDPTPPLATAPPPADPGRVSID
jgi:HSP20 family protein